MDGIGAIGRLPIQELQPTIRGINPEGADLRLVAMDGIKCAAGPIEG